jgi:hypothetical protein
MAGSGGVAVPGQGRPAAPGGVDVVLDRLLSVAGLAGLGAKPRVPPAHPPLSVQCLAVLGREVGLSPEWVAAVTRVGQAAGWVQEP